MLQGPLCDEAMGTAGTGDQHHNLCCLVRFKQWLSQVPAVPSPACCRIPGLQDSREVEWSGMLEPTLHMCSCMLCCSLANRNVHGCCTPQYSWLCSILIDV